MLVYKGLLLCNYMQTQVELVCYAVLCNLHACSWVPNFFCLFALQSEAAKKIPFILVINLQVLAVMFVMLFEFIAFLLCLSNHHGMFHWKTCHPFFGDSHDMQLYWLGLTCRFLRNQIITWLCTTLQRDQWTKILYWVDSLMELMHTEMPDLNLYQALLRCACLSWCTLLPCMW